MRTCFLFAAWVTIAVNGIRSVKHRSAEGLGEVANRTFSSDEAADKKNAFRKEATNAGVGVVVSAANAISNPSLTNIGGALETAGTLAASFGPAGVAVGGILSLVGGLMGLGGDPGPSNQDLLDKMTTGFREFNERLDVLTGRLDTIDSKLNLIGDQLNNIENRLRLMEATLNRIEEAVGEVSAAVNSTLKILLSQYEQDALFAYLDVLGRYDRLLEYLQNAASSTNPSQQDYSMGLYNDHLNQSYRNINHYRSLHFSKTRIQSIMRTFSADPAGKYCKMARVMKQIVSARWAWFFIMYHRNLYLPGCTRNCVTTEAVKEAVDLREDMKMMTDVMNEYSPSTDPERVSGLVGQSDEDLYFAEEKVFRVQDWAGFPRSYTIESGPIPKSGGGTIDPATKFIGGLMSDWGAVDKRGVYAVRPDYDECCKPMDWQSGYSTCGVPFRTNIPSSEPRMTSSECSPSGTGETFKWCETNVRCLCCGCVAQQLIDQGCRVAIQQWTREIRYQEFRELRSSIISYHPWAKSKCFD